jgi:hypothetical protein
MRIVAWRKPHYRITVRLRSRDLGLRFEDTTSPLKALVFPGYRATRGGGFMLAV